jgi:hypothetical protein
MSMRLSALSPSAAKVSVAEVLKGIVSLDILFFLKFFKIKSELSVGIVVSETFTN